MVGTEMVYFAAGELGLDGGIMVTASHNPKQYTGMKIVRRGALPVGERVGPLRGPRPRAAGGLARGEARLGRGGGRLGGVRRARCSRSSTSTRSRPLRVVVDAANGMAGAMLPPVLARLPQVEVVRCYFEPDGSFPNHEPNPLLPENREFIVAADASRRSAAFGVAYDGDADRCFFVDDRGEFVPGDFTTALFAESILAREPGGKVIYDVRASWAVPEAIERAGGVPLVNRVGHSFIKQRMREVDAVFAGEVSAHYYFRDFSQADSGVDPVPAHARARLAARPGAERDPGAAALALLPHRRDQHAGRRRRAEAAGAQGALRRRGHASPTSTGSRSTPRTGT